MSTILKCKMCGGDISVNADMTVGTCQYCGSTMTIPHIDSDKKARLFNWANQLRLNNEFDKAYDAYKEIVSEDTEESEAYWGMILSEYGVEYVEDPKTKKRVPTCHRTIQQSLKKNANYEMACKYADIESRFMYQNEADILDKIQKKILSISSKQEEYDVFICYKESEDESGERTADSVLAQDIYDELCKKGISTFFSRITLKDKLGEDYEPYIYSALKSAKVMVVVATSVEHFESPWVRNEWSRFLAFMAEDDEKRIIPAYKNMTAYELPDELSPYQAQNMDKIGAIQDLTVGIGALISDKSDTRKALSENDVISIVKANEEKEKQEADLARANKKKESLKRLSKIAALLAIIMLALSIVSVILRSVISKEDLESRNTIIETGIPDNNELDYFIVNLTDSNFNEYFEARKFDGNWYLYSLAFDHGWILYNCEDFSANFKFIIIDKVYKGKITEDPINADITPDHNPLFNRNYKFSECKGKLFFVSVNALSELSYKNGCRTIMLKNQFFKMALDNYPRQKKHAVGEYRW